MMKSSKLFFGVLAALMLCFSGCDNTLDNFDTDKDPLVGKIGGEDWSYISGGAKARPTTSQIEGFLTGLNVIDPCTIRVLGEPYLELSLPSRIANYNLPSASGEVKLVFVSRNGDKRLSVTGGYLEIVALSGRQALGRINATVDDDNFVEGSFLLEICN
ncbi:MAG: hypothetical protein JXR10_03250 [Cyclobacteriaceae bacterium]